MLFHLRSYIFTVYMYVTALIIASVCFPSLLKRDWAMKVSKAWASVALWGLRNICGIDRCIQGTEVIPDGPAIIAGKHQSMWETIFLAAALPHPSFVLKKELKRLPIFGWWCARSGFIFVDRKAGAKALRQMISDAQNALDQGSSHIIIFPEGTRTRVGERASYQPGVAALVKALQLPILPVAHNSGCYWRHYRGDKIPGTITLQFMEPISSSTPRTELMKRLEDVIEPATRALESKAERATASSPRATQETAPHG